MALSGQVFEACTMKAHTDSFLGWGKGEFVAPFLFCEVSLLLNSSAWSAGSGRLVDERKLKKGRRWAP
jgi:hypothetical protein